MAEPPQFPQPMKPAEQEAFVQTLGSDVLSLLDNQRIAIESIAGPERLETQEQRQRLQDTVRLFIEGVDKVTADLHRQIDAVPDFRKVDVR